MFAALEIHSKKRGVQETIVFLIEIFITVFSVSNTRHRNVTSLTDHNTHDDESCTFIMNFQ